MRWIVIVLLLGLVLTQVPGRFGAEASTASECESWVIAIIPVPEGCSLATQGPNCQPPEGWEPVSGIVYGADGSSGVLLRRCTDD
jgi:hypothetical protein